MRQLFVSKNFRSESLELLDLINEVIGRYQDQGLKLTLRQAYYQLVTINAIPNSEKSYKKVGSLISDARLAGLLDWDAIEDRVRVPKKPPQYDSLKDLIEAALWSYRLPRLEGQETYVEVMIEKEALAGVFAPIANRHHVVLSVNKGYSSQSAIYETAERISRACFDEEGSVTAEAVILYVGDFDPSGEDMVRDVGDRVRLLLSGGEGGEDPLEHLISPPDDPDVVPEEGVDYPMLTVEKIALTKEQIAQYNPPPNPAKISDSRAAAFIAKHGSSSWEVDALPPEVLRDLVSDAISLHVDQGMVDEIIAREISDKVQLKSAVDKIMRR